MDGSPMLAIQYSSKYIRIYINMRNYYPFYRFAGHRFLSAFFLVVVFFLVKRDGLPLLTPLEGLFLVVRLVTFFLSICHLKSLFTCSTPELRWHGSSIAERADRDKRFRSRSVGNSSCHL